jgi:hypothetical protein
MRRAERIARTVRNVMYRKTLKTVIFVWSKKKR